MPRAYRRANLRTGGRNGRQCAGRKCRQFLKKDYKDHYCSSCRSQQKSQRERLQQERDPRWHGESLRELLLS